MKKERTTKKASKAKPRQSNSEAKNFEELAAKLVKVSKREIDEKRQKP
jgi:hypothetical protein